MNLESKKEFEFLKKFNSGHKTEENYESLDQHSIKTADFFKRYIYLRQIKFNFKSLSDDKKQELVKFIEEIIFLHDLGKINPHSQKYYKGLINKSPETEHSQLSFILILIGFILFK